VIGRNGTGKSTLLQIVSGDLSPEQGVVWREPGLRIGRLAQDALVADDRRVFDIVAEGFVHSESESWQSDQKVAKVLSRLQIPADASVACGSPEADVARQATKPSGRTSAAPAAGRP